MSMNRRIHHFPTDVYRLYNRAGQLLYVGVALNGYARLETHRREKHWWPDVARVRMTRYATRRIALYVEACAIRDEHPVHNVAHTIPCAIPQPFEPLEVDEFEVA